MPAQIATVKSSDNDVQLFTGQDAYRFDVDNRPLRNLIQNDLNLKAVLDSISTEVFNARIDNSTGAAIEYSTLDARLEALSLTGLSNSSVSYSIFQAQAERNRALYPSGWLVTPTTLPFNGTQFAGDDFGCLAGSRQFGFASTSPEPNAMIMNTEYDGQFMAVPLLVNGWLVKMYWMNAGGAAGTTSTSYPYNTIKLPAPPTSGGRLDLTFLEVWLKKIPASNPVFWLYGSPQYKAASHGEGVPVLCTTSDPANGAYNTGNYTTNPLDRRVVHTLARLDNGDWLQVQHRIRIVANINGTTPDGFSGPNASIVYAQGSTSAPVVGKAFTNMLGTLGDAGLFRAGAGAADSSSLGTYDGHVYAIPMATINRRNTAVFTQTDQNGAAKSGVSGSGTMASAVSGRPDGLFYDEIDRADFLDQRHMADYSNIDPDRLMQQAISDLMRGTSRLQWQALNYTDDTNSALPIYGNRLLTNDTIFDQARYPVGGSAAMVNSNWVADRSISAAAYSSPEKVRRVYAANTEQRQRTEFWIDPFTATVALKSQFADITGFITVTTAGSTCTVRIDPTVLSGGATGGVNATKIGSRIPVWHWVSDNQGISFTSTAGVGGSNAIDYVFDVTGRSNEKVLCNIDFVYPPKSGTKNIPVEIVRQEFFDGTNSHFSQSIPTVGTAWHTAKASNGDIYSVDDANRVTIYRRGADGVLAAVSGWITSANVVSWATNGFAIPYSIAVFGNPLADNGTGVTGCVYLYELYNQRIRKYAYNTGTSQWSLIGTVNSNPTLGATFTLSSVQETFGGSLVGLDVSPDGASLFVSCWAKHSILKFATGSISNGAQPSATLIAGVHGTPGNTSATGNVRLFHPANLSVDPDTSGGVKLWVADYWNQRALRITTTSAASCDVEVELKNSDGTGGALPAEIINIEHLIACGTPGVNLHYIVSAGPTVGTTDTNARVFKLDENFNIIARSDFKMARIGGVTVDNPASPTYIYVARGGATPAGSHPDIRILNYNEIWNGTENVLPTVTKLPAVLMSQMGTITALTRVSNGTQNYLFANTGAQTFIATVTGASVGAFSKASWNASAADTYNGFYSSMRVISTVPTVYMTVMDLAGGGTGKLHKITWNGSAWVRGASVVSFTQLPYGVEMDAAFNVYVSFPIDSNYAFPNFPNGGNVVKRYAATTHTLTGTFGNGTVGGATNQITGPSYFTYVSSTGKMVVAARKSLAFSSPSPDQSRFVFLKTDDASWTAGTQYDSDTNNNAVLSLDIDRPFQVISDGVDEIYIVDYAKHAVYKMKRAIAADSQSYQLVGKFGVSYEPGNDHGHLTSPRSASIIMVGGGITELVVSDSSAARLLKVNTKMAGISLATGNIETMTPLVSAATGTSERLRVWSYNQAYQGVGNRLILSNEPVYNKQVLAESDFVFVTTLGRSPLKTKGTLTNSTYRNLIARLPLGGKAANLDEASFAGELLTAAGMDPDHASGLLKLPILTHGLSSQPAFADSSSEGGYVAYFRVEDSLKANVHRGFNSNISDVGTTFAAPTAIDFSELTTSGSDWQATVRYYANRLVIRPFIIKRDGRVYLLVVTQVLANTQDGASAIGSATTGQYTAADLFEVPGRLLYR